MREPVKDPFDQEHGRSTLTDSHPSSGSRPGRPRYFGRSSLGSGVRPTPPKLREHDAAGGTDMDVLRRINEEYAADVERYQPRWRNVVTTIGWNIPSAIPLVAIPAGVAQTRLSVGGVLRHRNHWTDTLMCMRRRVRP